MDENDNKRGFSGLSNLTSDTRIAPQVQPRQANPQPSVSKKSVFALLDMTKWPTLPAPWSSVNSGETWIWGDFFLTFQKKPKTVLDLTMEMQGKKAESRGMTYHYCMSVFYRIDRNPHGPSHRPIMTIALEQADMGMLAKMLGSEAGELLQAKGGSKMGPLMIGLFTGETRLNLGEYEGDTSPEAVKRRFFEILGRQLGASGQPKMIGDLAQAYGHPETGLLAKKKNSEGFSVLSDLAPDVSGSDDPIKPETKSEAKPTPQPQQETTYSDAERKTTNSRLSDEKAGSDKSNGSSGIIWIFGILFVLFVIGVNNNAGLNNKKASYTSTTSSQNNSGSFSGSEPIAQTSDIAHETGLQYTKPSIGSNFVLSVPEIRWCIRGGIRIEAMRDVIENNDGIDEFNRIVNDYNSRCGSYRYRQGSQSRAERDVEAYRTQIVAEAIREARQLGSSPSSSSQSTSTNSSSKKPNSQYTKEAQQILTDLGYAPGPVDGDYGRHTADAVKSFQRDLGVTQDGWIDEDLLSVLRRVTSQRPVRNQELNRD